MPTEIQTQEMFQMLRNGAKYLEAQVEAIDALNVFPVPDGDTGTNMNLSFQSGIQEMQANQTNSSTISDTMSCFSRGIMMGARGNSGVILSQLFRGMSQAMKGKQSINAEEFAVALEKGVEIAYKAVMKPVEGTILTVAREAAKAASKASRRMVSIEDVFRATIEQAEYTLSQTPEMLPVLKEVGVVDAGGKGLIIIYQGMYQALTGEELAFDQNEVIKPSSVVSQDIHTGEEFGYCTEFIIQNVTDVNEPELRNELSEMGDSLLVVHDEDFVKIHIHTLDPGQVLSHCLQLGSLHRIKIENMTEQNEHVQAQAKQEPMTRVTPKKDYGIVAVTNGEGIKDIFKSLGADQIVFGGQSMNPSTEDLANAVRQINADTVIILPNNKNIILAAEQVSNIIDDKKIIVIPSKSIPQGIAAVLAFHEEQEMEDNIEVMKEAMEGVISGQVTYAVRDTQMNGTVIKEGDILGIKGSDIVATGDHLIETTMELLKSMIDIKNHEIITIFTGQDTTQEQVDELQTRIEDEYVDFEIEIKNGKQPTYFFIISVE